MTTNHDIYSKPPATSVIFRSGKSVVKIISQELQCGRFVYENELKWLSGLKLPFVPNLLYFDDYVIVTEYVGVPLTNINTPKDLEEQLYTIVNVLHCNNCYHNDVKPTNLMVKNGKISIIDFGWATKGPLLPNWFPDVLNEDFSTDDYKAVEMILDFIKRPICAVK